MDEEQEAELEIDRRVRRAHERLSRLSIVGSSDVIVEGGWDTGYAVNSRKGGGLITVAAGVPAGLGACCQNPTSPTCTYTDAAGCASIGGFFLGMGTNCTSCAGHVHCAHSGCGFSDFLGHGKFFLRADYSCFAYQFKDQHSCPDPPAIGNCAAGEFETQTQTYTGNMYQEYDPVTCELNTFCGTAQLLIFQSRCDGDLHNCDFSGPLVPFCGGQCRLGSCVYTPTTSNTETTQIIDYVCANPSPKDADTETQTTTLSNECIFV